MVLTHYPMLTETPNSKLMHEYFTMFDFVRYFIHMCTVICFWRIKSLITGPISLACQWKHPLRQSGYLELTGTWSLPWAGSSGLLLWKMLWRRWNSTQGSFTFQVPQPSNNAQFIKQTLDTCICDPTTLLSILRGIGEGGTGDDQEEGGAGHTVEEVLPETLLLPQDHWVCWTNIYFTNKDIWYNMLCISN